MKGVSMCKAFEDMKEEGRMEGKIEGRIEGKMEGKAEAIVEMGREFRLSQNVILEKLQSKLNIPVEEAQKFFVMFSK